MRAPDLLDRLSRGWRAWALLALLSLANALPGVFAVPPMDRDESRFAQASLQMLETGDFVRIAFQDQPRNKKPVAIYWLQAGSVSLFSTPGARAIWAYRLPSVLGALLAVLATFAAGKTLLARRIAFLGAALFACALLMGVEAMTAKTDAMLCAMTTIAMAALAFLYARGPSKAAALTFWAALAAGILVKGPVTPLAAGGALVMLYAWERKGAWMRVLRWWPGPLLAGAILLPWCAAIWVDTDGRFFSDAIGGDLGGKVVGGAEGHAGPPLYHAALVWILLFPATLALPAALRVIWRTIRAPRAAAEYGAHRFLVSWVAPLWIVFELLPTKLPHYVLPAYPALALLCALALDKGFAENWPKLRLTARLIAVAGALVMVALTAALSTFLPGDADASQKRAVQTAITGLVLFAPALYVALRAKAPGALAGAACAAALVFSFTARERILPRAHNLFVSAAASDALFRAGLHPRLSAGAGTLTIVGDDEPSLVFLTRTDTRDADAASAAALAQPGAPFLVESRARAALAAALARRGLAFAPIGDPAIGLDYANGKRLVLQPGRIVTSAGATKL